MKLFIKNCLTVTLVAAMIVCAFCIGTGVSAAESSGGQNVIRIVVDGDTFNNPCTDDNQQMYCVIYDTTADESISSWMGKNAKMIRDGDSDTWSYDLDAHGITMDPAHIYDVVFSFSAGDVHAMTQELVINGYDSTKDYTAVFTELYTNEAFTQSPKYLYKWTGDNEFDVGLDIIRISPDKNTFWQPVENLYCTIVDETAYERVMEMGRLTKEASGTWSFDLGKHGVALKAEHTYSVVFHDERSQTEPLTISAYDRAEDYTAVSINSGATYVWSKDHVMIYGDADCDGTVTINDATAIQRVLAGLDAAPFNEKAADADGNGLSVSDATMIQRFLAGMIPQLN